MSIVEQSIAEIQGKIIETRKRASLLKSWGGFLRGPGWLIVYATGCGSLIVGILEGFHTIFFPGSYLIYKSWLYLTSGYPAIWGLLPIISPPFKSSPTGALLLTPVIIWLICWAFWISSFVELGKKAMARSHDLRKQADADENTLQFQAPTWRQLDILTQVQSNNISGISGNANTINATNQINNILQRQDESKGWWTKPLGIFLIGLAINMASKAIESLIEALILRLHLFK